MMLISYKKLILIDDEAGTSCNQSALKEKEKTGMMS